MQPIFTIQYGQFATADYIKSHLKNTSVFIPSSSQEKGIDLILYRFNDGKGKIQTVQVKTSRIYFSHDKDDIVGYFWFNKFKIPENADWIVLVGIVPVKYGKNIDNITNIKWECKFLCLSNEEARNFMTNLKTKSGNPDSKFGFCYDVNNNFFLSRGGNWNSLNSFLLLNKLKEIDSKLK